MDWVNMILPETALNSFTFSVKSWVLGKGGGGHEGLNLLFLQEGPNFLDFW